MSVFTLIAQSKGVDLNTTARVDLKADSLQAGVEKQPDAEPSQPFLHALGQAEDSTSRELGDKSLAVNIQAGVIDAQAEVPLAHSATGGPAPDPGVGSIPLDAPEPNPLLSQEAPVDEVLEFTDPAEGDIDLLVTDSVAKAHQPHLPPMHTQLDAHAEQSDGAVDASVPAPDAPRVAPMTLESTLSNEAAFADEPEGEHTLSQIDAELEKVKIAQKTVDNSPVAKNTTTVLAQAHGAYVQDASVQGRDALTRGEPLKLNSAVANVSQRDELGPAPLSSSPKPEVKLVEPALEEPIGFDEKLTNAGIGIRRGVEVAGVEGLHRGTSNAINKPSAGSFLPPANVGAVSDSASASVAQPSVPGGGVATPLAAIITPVGDSIQPSVTGRVEDIPELIAPSKIDTAAVVHKPETVNSSFSQGSVGAVGGRVALPIELQFGHEKWSGLVAERTASLVMQSVHSAHLQLDPPELGPLAVKIQVHQDQATVHFLASSPMVKEALDSTLVKLKEMLQEQGLALSDSSVSDQSQSREKHQQAPAWGAEQDPADDTAGALNSASTVSIASGIDYFV